MVLGCGEIPGQELVDAVDGVLGDLFEHATEIKLRIKPVELGCPQQRVDSGGAVPAGIGTAEQKVLSSQSHNTQCPLGR